jgi:hypothetical protein
MLLADLHQCYWVISMDVITQTIGDYLNKQLHADNVLEFKKTV